MGQTPDQDSEVENYLEHIHDQDQLFSSPLNYAPSMSHYQRYTLILEKGQALLLNKQKLVEKHLNDLFSKLSPDSDTIPLLVSRPINLTKAMTKKQETFIKSIGFDIDFLEEKTLVLRSFPKALQHLPYLSLLEYVLTLGPKHLKELKFTHYPIKNIQDQLIENLYQDLNSIEKTKNIVLPIKEEDLQRLYEQQK